MNLKAFLQTLLGLVICAKIQADSFQYKYCIIGGGLSKNFFSLRLFFYINFLKGPAGLQLAYFLSKSNRDYIVFERNNNSGGLLDHFKNFSNFIFIDFSVRFVF